jgi:transposase
MYMRTISRTNKDGSRVQYVQLAHNVRDRKTGNSKAEVLYNFGRRDQLDLEAIRRLIRSLSRFLDPDDSLQAQVQAENDSPVTYKQSWEAGGPLLLRGLWRRLRIDRVLKRALQERGFSSPVEDALFAMVANRALAPSSKLAVEDWAKETVALGGSQALQVQHFYRAMDFLLEHQAQVQEKVFRSVVNLLNLQVDVIFFDTTNIFFETEDTADSELKALGPSKEKRDDLPLVTVGLAVTRSGIPVGCWVLPGNQHDATSVEQVQRDLAGWQLNRVVWVMDRGMTSEQNKRILQQAGGDYILGEKLRGNNDSEKALSRGGRYKTVKDNLQIKEVILGSGATRRRYVIMYNPEEAERDKATRQSILDRVQAELDALQDLSVKKRAEARKRLLNHKTWGRYLKELKNGQLTWNKARIRDDAKLDGKHLVSSSNEELSAEELALGYKQLMDVERGFRTMKTTLDLRPVYHRRDDRIRSHVVLCWLALLLIRVAETELGQSWDRIRSEFQKLRLGEFLTRQNRILQHTQLTTTQRNMLKNLNLKPPRIIKSIEERA